MLMLFSNEIVSSSSARDETGIVQSDFVKGRLSTSQAEVIENAISEMPNARNNYFLTGSWNCPVPSCEDPWKSAFFPVFFCHNYLNNLSKEYANVLIVFDNPHTRDMFFNHYRKSAVSFDGNLPNACLIAHSNSKNRKWFVPRVFRETETLKKEEPLRYRSLNSGKWKRHAFSAGDIDERVRRGLFVLLPVCSLDRKSIDMTESVVLSKPSIVLVFLENESYFPSRERWKAFFPRSDGSKFVIVTMSPNQLPSPNVLDGTQYIYTNLTEKNIRGCIQKEVLHEYDRLFTKEVIVKLQETLMKLKTVDRVGYRAFFCLLSAICNLRPGEYYRIDGIQKASLDMLSSKERDDALGAVYAAADKIANTLPPFGKSKYLSENQNAFDRFVVFGYSDFHEIPREKIHSTEETQGTPSGRLLIQGVPRLNGTYETIKLKQINTRSEQAKILLAGTLEETLFDLLFSNELFYDKLHKKGINRPTKNISEEIIPRMKRGAVLPTEEELNMDIFKDFAEMKKYRTEAHNNAITSRKNTGDILKGLTVRLEDEKGSKFELYLTKESEHTITVKRGRAKLSVFPKDLAAGDAIEKSSWNYTELVDAIRRLILADPKQKEEVREKIEECLDISARFRSKLASEDIPGLIARLESKGHSIDEMTVWSWVDITMNPSKTDCLAEIGSMLGYAEKEMKRVINAFAHLKMLRALEPLSKLDQTDAKIKLYVKEIIETETRLEYVGRYRAIQ